MCEFCFEGMFLSSLESGTRIKSSLLDASYLQDSPNLVDEIKRIRKLDHSETYINIIFCRVLDRYITHGFDSSYYDLITSSISLEAKNSFFGRDKAYWQNDLWEELGKKALYIDENNWNNFFADRANILNNALDMLCAYHDSFEGNCDLENSIEQTGIVNHVDSKLPIQAEKYDSMFPALSFSLSFVSKYFSESEILSKIVLNPEIYGNGFWLQRRALISCVKQYGLEFIFTNLNAMRLELIYYLLLKIDINRIELRKLKRVLSANRHIVSFTIEAKHLINLISRLELKKNS